jgi:hypothetical protein
MNKKCKTSIDISRIPNLFLAILLIAVLAFVVFTVGFLGMWALFKWFNFITSVIGMP